MGIFDFFKKKTSNQEIEEPVATEVPVQAGNPGAPGPQHDPEFNTNHYIDDREDGNEARFNAIHKYAEYVVRFLGMMFQDVTAPIAAYEKPDGELIGFLYVGGDDGYSLTAAQVVERMETEFKKRINEQQIKSWVILYHSEFKKDGNHTVAGDARDMSAITVRYEFNGGVEHLAIPYTMKGDEVKFKGFNGFSGRQNKAVLSTELVNNKDYFQERVEMKAEIFENEAGLQIKKVNNGSLGDMWGGILGFERQANSRNLLIEYMAVTFMSDYLKHTTPELSVYEMSYGDVIFRGVKTANDSRRTVVPHVRSAKRIDVVNKQINEWENAGGLEAVISGSGRETFGVTYFATDYAANKDTYHSTPKLDVLFSGILFVLAEAETNAQNADNDITLSDEFTGYMPHKELSEFGCFEFIGMVQDFYKNDILEHGAAEGFIAQIKLINNGDDEDFFAIPMFISKQNMRSAELRKGMKVSGVFQLLGEIRRK